MKTNIRNGSWESLEACDSYEIAMDIILDFLIVFPKFGDSKSIQNNGLQNNLLEPDRRKKTKYLLGILTWLAKLMNIIASEDKIQDTEKIEDCYRTVALKLIPLELVGRMDLDGTPKATVNQHMDFEELLE